MHHARTMMILAGVLALLSGAVWLTGRGESQPEAGRPLTSPEARRPERRPSPAASQTDTEQRLQQVEVQLQQLQTQQRELLKLHRELSHLVSTLTAQATSTSPTVKDDSVSEPSRAVEAVQEQEHFALLEADLARQALDPAWSTTAVHQIATAIEQVVDGFEEQIGDEVMLLESHCATTLCRFEVAYDSPVAMAQFMSEFPHRLGWNTSAHMQTIDHPDGSGGIVVYLAREGYPLPTQEE